MRKPLPKPRKVPAGVAIVYERSIARMFLDAGFDLRRQPDNSIALVKDDHRVPLYAGLALHFELSAPQLILSKA